MEQNRKKSGISSNLLRCIATMFVVLLHGRSHIPKIDELSYFVKWISCFPAWAGVWIFLFLSGYGIGYGFFSGKYILQKNGKISLKLLAKFYIGRFIKIAPIYYVYCIIFEILSGNLFFWSNYKILLKMFTFTFNGNGGIVGLGHLWYVSLAMQLYLFMPIIFIVLNSIKNNKYIMMFMMILVASWGIIIRSYIVNKGYDWYTYSYTNCWVNIDLIVFGMMVSKIKLEYRMQLKNKRIIKSFSSLIFISLVIYNCYIYKIGTINYLFIYRCILPTAYAISCSLVLLLSNGCLKNKIESMIEKMIAFFSKYSYAVYIWHIAVFKYLDLTLSQTNWFNERSAITQYIVFFGICFILIIILAVPITYFGDAILQKYSKVEKKVFK